MLLDEYGLKMVLYPHGDSHIETSEEIGRIFDATDPTYVNLCLDSGRVVYGGGRPGGSSRPTGGWREAFGVKVAAAPVGGNGAEMLLHVDRLCCYG